MKEETPKCRAGKRGWFGRVLFILLLLLAVNSTRFFIGTLGVGVRGWLSMNSCAPSIFTYLVGCALCRCGGTHAVGQAVMVAGAVNMARYGTMGLFVFSWSGITGLIVQSSHLTMTVAVLRVLCHVFLFKKIKVHTAAAGLALGFLILAALTANQWQWFAAHPGVLDRLFSGDLDPSIMGEQT
ncbi:hypothetical protein Pelo_11811 [Pelomyxa schiedti]|nr:hypothetical protein Pelo_11811 [Pelomyxa schiedti]